MTGGTFERLAVALAERSYDILVGPGLIARAGAEILPLMQRRQAVVVTDEIVAPLYLNPLCASLDTAGIAVATIILPPRRAKAEKSGLDESRIPDNASRRPLYLPPSV